MNDLAVSIGINTRFLCKTPVSRNLVWFYVDDVVKTVLSTIINRKSPAMYDSYDDSMHGPPDGPSRVHLKKKGNEKNILYFFPEIQNGKSILYFSRGDTKCFFHFVLVFALCKEGNVLHNANTSTMTPSIVTGPPSP